MRMILCVALALSVGLCVFGCQKKQQSLEEMQQPMSPEDLNRLSSQPAAPSPVPVEPGIMNSVSSDPFTPGTIVTATGDLAAEQKLEPLPPSGPFKPSDREIQTALKNAGYYTGSIDGKIGPRSKKAIEDFQKASGLKADGKVGPKTWGALSRYLNPVSAADASVSGNTAEVPIDTGR
ncbi:MAG: peptidoglycan-binding domain-containing protein [Candidatus Omnitrophica bacterium]|nr:peptidoglycan-binding domain-containing protein [Candidatus Omnitrophota bacterium]